MKKVEEAVKSEEKVDPWKNLGSGNTLSGRGTKRAAEETKVKDEVGHGQEGSSKKEVIDATMLDEDDFWGDEDVIEIDSD